jgi:hypothetical protein
MSLRLFLHINKSTTETNFNKILYWGFTTFYRRVSILCKNQTKIKDMLHDDACAFCADIERDLLNIYRSETFIHNKVYRKINYMFYFQIWISLCLMAFGGN